MNLEIAKKEQAKNENALAERLARRASRHLVNKTDKAAFNPAMGLSFLGALGWNIPIPTFLGAMLGRWMDANYKTASVSWTLNFLLLGFLVGLVGAWQWLKREGIDRAQKEQNRRNALVDQAEDDADARTQTFEEDGGEQ